MFFPNSIRSGAMPLLNPLSSATHKENLISQNFSTTRITFWLSSRVSPALWWAFCRWTLKRKINNTCTMGPCSKAQSSKLFDKDLFCLLHSSNRRRWERRQSDFVWNFVIGTERTRSTSRRIPTPRTTWVFCLTNDAYKTIGITTKLWSN